MIYIIKIEINNLGLGNINDVLAKGGVKICI